MLIILYISFISKNRLVSPIPINFSKNNKISVNPDLKNQIEEILKQNNIKYSSLTMSDDYFTFQTEDGAKIIISQKKDLSKQFSSLQLILSRSTIEGKKFSMIDFRFDKPLMVIR